MSAKQPEVDIASALATAGLGTLNTDMKYGPPGTSAGNPGIALWVTSIGGAAPEPFLDAANQGSRYESTVQVIVWGSSSDVPAARTKARSVRDALHTKSLSGYWSCTAQQSEPLDLGPNDGGQPQYAVNVTLKWVITN